MGRAPTQSLDDLPSQARSVSLAYANEPLPRKLKMAALAIVLVAVVGAAYFLLVHSPGGKKSDARSTVITVPVPVVDKETRLKAALHDLENGKTCADRKLAVPVLVQIGDERAIPALKKARRRMRGGVLGIGDSNTNACLKSDAEIAIEALGGKLR